MKLKELISTHPSKLPPVISPYIIAEAGVNHEGSMDLAKRLIDEAKEGGANAIKFQTYKAGTLASKHSPAYWDLSKEKTTSQYELFKKHDKFWKKEFVALKQYCDATEIEFLSTPFDKTSALFLNDLMPVYKISSSDITNKPFIELICTFNKPLILSTGASFEHEVHEAVSWIKPFGNALALLHCILNYPTEDKNAHLGRISTLKKRFPDQIIGYSDHTLPKDMTTLISATLLGSIIIEKHFTFDKTLPGNDHYHAMDKVDLKNFRTKFKGFLELIGNAEISPLQSEERSRKNARRSLITAQAISKGAIITEEMLTWKRPAHGISPKDIALVVGKTAKRDLEEDSIINWSDLC